MYKIKTNYIKYIFSLLILTSMLSSCMSPSNNQESNQAKDTSISNVEGMWELLTYQPQDDTLFIEMTGINIKKVFYGNEWMSIAINTENNKVVHTAGGQFVTNQNTLSEEVLYHQKNLESIGDINTFNVSINNDTLYLSGILKPDTEDEYKIEEYWVRVSN